MSLVLFLLMTLTLCLIKPSSQPSMLSTAQSPTPLLPLYKQQHNRNSDHHRRAILATACAATDPPQHRKHSLPPISPYIPLYTSIHPYTPLNRAGALSYSKGISLNSVHSKEASDGVILCPSNGNSKHQYCACDQSNNTPKKTSKNTRPSSVQWTGHSSLSAFNQSCMLPSEHVEQQRLSVSNYH